MASRWISFLCVVGSALANPINLARQVNELDQAAFKEAQQRDDTAIRSFSNVQIKTSTGRCLFVNALSGDFRANLTPIQIVGCNSTSGQGWDIITSGKHIDQEGFLLFVSTETQACFNADPRRKQGDQVNLFSCGGRADGTGEVTDAQLWATDGEKDRFRLSPKNGAGFCLVANEKSVDIETCDEKADSQWFSLRGAAGYDAGGGSNHDDKGSTPASTPQVPSAQPQTTASGSLLPSFTDSPVLSSPPSPVASSSDATLAVPVSRAGGILNPSAVAESHDIDDTATRAKQGIHVRSSDGRCLVVDPTACDFRENLIPVGLTECNGGADGQKFDIVTEGRHNDGKTGGALVVSSLTNGCISFDARRAAGDTVTVFSCGGRADGSGETDVAQLYPFDAGSGEMILRPASGNDVVCLVAGNQQLESGTCTGQKPQIFELVQDV